MTDGTKRPDQRRRYLLKSSALASASTVLGAGTASAESYGNVEFVSIGWFHHVESDLDDGVEKVQTTYIPGHYLDTEERVLYLNKFADDETRQTFKEENKVVWNRDYVSYPVQGHERKARDQLTTQLNHNNRPLGGLVLMRAYAHQPLSVEKGRNSVTVRGNSRQTKVPARDQRELTLEHRTVRASTWKKTGETQQEDAMGEREVRPEFKRYGTDVSVKPVLRIRNHGVVEVREDEKMQYMM